MAASAAILGCNRDIPVRIYDAPKADTEFVSGPLAGAKTVGRSTPSAGLPTSGPRRILGAVIPLESGCYFLKATDAPDRLQPLMADFLTIVSDFTIAEASGKPEMPLPNGWSMNPRNDIAMAEFISPESTGNIKFTVTVLSMPPASDWPSYLLSNINRWRGQLKLPDLASSDLADELISVDRKGSLLPGYIFDAIGNGSGGMSSGGPSVTGGPVISSPPPNAPTAPPSPLESSTAGSGSERPADSPPGDSEAKPELQYEIPPGWESAPGSPFRLATFQVKSAEGDGEVTVSMAVDNPLANSMMWYQQVTREADQDTIKSLAESTIAQAETIPAGSQQATLYTIRDSEQDDAPVLLVASFPSPRPDLHVFVKLRGDNKLVRSQRDNFDQFVQSLSLK